jgi:hypothetical protein
VLSRRGVAGGLDLALSPAPFNYQGGGTTGPTQLINGGEGTATCGTSNASQDLARFAADSIVSPGATYDHPNTDMRFFWCTSATTNEVTGLGSFYYDAITSSKSSGCYTGCTGEMVGQDDAGYADIHGSMLMNCTPRH